MFGGNPALCPLDASSNLCPSFSCENRKSRLCQMSLGVRNKIIPDWELKLYRKKKKLEHLKSYHPVMTTFLSLVYVRFKIWFLKRLTNLEQWFCPSPTSRSLTPMGLPTHKSPRMNSDGELCGPAPLSIKIDLKGERVEICRKRQFIEDASVSCFTAFSIQEGSCSSQ